MQGIFVGGARAKTKKALKEAVVSDPTKVWIEATSFFGNEYEGALNQAPEGTYYVVGPDPYKSRKWYAQVRVGKDLYHVS